MHIKTYIAAMALSVLAAPATALTTFNVGTTHNVVYNGIIDGNVQSGLTASIDFTLDSITQVGTNYLAAFSYDLTNTSGTPITASRISIFGFNVASDGFNFADSFGASNPFATKATGSLPQGSNTLDICFKGGGGPNCSGGGGGGVTLGNDASGNFTLAFSQALTSVALDDFLVRYQAINGMSDAGKKLNGASGIGIGEVAPIPEPATWAMLIAGFGMVGFAMRRRRGLASVSA